MTGISRRDLLAAAGATACLSPKVAARPSAVLPISASNPLIRQRADTQIFRHSDGLYYMMGSVPEYDRLVMRKSPTLAGLSSAPEAVIWRRPTSGKLGGHIWAPELHHFDGRWHIYFAAGDSDARFRIRTYVLQSAAPDPLRGSWQMLGQLVTPWDSFTLDSTIFEHRETRYIFWAQQEPGIATNSNLYVAPLATPTTLAVPPLRLTVPTLPWEVQGFKVAEGPAILHRNGRLFLTYSASATDDRYAMGLLTADEDADLMLATSWTKSAEPVFKSSPVTNVYGPGHNSFTVDEQGRDVIVYHGRDYQQIKGDPLYDPNRHTRIQRIYYDPAGVPDFALPVGNGPVPDRFSPWFRPGAYMRIDAGTGVVAAGDVPTSQFRRMPLPGARGEISLEPILAPGQVISWDSQGQVSVAGNVDRRSSGLIVVPGLAHGQGISFRAAGMPGRYLQDVNGVLMVGQAAGDNARRNATFRVS